MIGDGKTIYIFYSILFIFLKTSIGDEAIKVTIKQGILSGKVEKSFFKQQDYYVFKGIPYAVPPVDKLRFKPPIAHAGWEGVYESQKTHPKCLQMNTKRMGESFGISGSEDCLYLNIFTPSILGSKAVVVFEYNDNFQLGYNGTDIYSPEFFIDEDVIVVTISHRLGIMGYLTTEDEVIPGNNGIRDFILGLTWIRNNIENFGGDPTRVTLMGSRGGAVIANMLLYVEQAKNLFSAAIIQSGSAFETIFFHSNPKRAAYKLAEFLNITAKDSTTLLEEFNKIKADQLLKLEADVLMSEPMGSYQMATSPFAPTIEPINKDALLTSFPENSRLVSDVPVLIGFNSNDGIDFISKYILMNPASIVKETNNFLVNFPIRSGFRFDPNSTIYEDAIKEIKNYYLKNGEISYANILEYALYVADTLQNYALNYAAKKLASDLTSPLFYYMFDFFGMLNENSLFITKYAMISMANKGATVTDELCYLHMCSRLRKKYEELHKLITEQIEIKTVKRMVRLWTNFAKTGNPTPSIEDNLLKNLIWEPLAKNNADAHYLHIDKKLKMKLNPLGEREQFWNQFLDKYSKMAVDGVVTSTEPRDEL